jgi:hypothetical protein
MITDPTVAAVMNRRDKGIRFIAQNLQTKRLMRML